MLYAQHSTRQQQYLRLHAMSKRQMHWHAYVNVNDVKRVLKSSKLSRLNLCKHIVLEIVFVIHL